MPIASGQGGRQSEIKDELPVDLTDGHLPVVIATIGHCQLIILQNNKTIALICLYKSSGQLLKGQIVIGLQAFKIR